MATKHFETNNLGTVTVTKSRRSKHMRLTVKHDGSLLVSIPNWTPYKVGLDFAESKKDWVINNRPAKSIIVNGTKVGKAHWLHIEPTDGSRFSTRINENVITLKYPSNLTIESPEVQKAAKKASVKALTVQAESLLPGRLHALATTNDFAYKNVRIRSLKSRWGSCNSKGEIVLNCYLMQLSWKEIDYVLLHELTHTKHMSHNRSFWQTLLHHMPEAKEVRKSLADRKPQLVVL